MISLTCLNNTVQSASELITYSDSDIWADSMLLDLLVELIKCQGSNEDIHPRAAKDAPTSSLHLRILSRKEEYIFHFLLT